MNIIFAVLYWAFTAQGYLSCRITGRKGFTTHDNVLRTLRLVKTLGMNVVNPGWLNMYNFRRKVVWTEWQYMTLWYIVLIILRLRGKSMYITLIDSQISVGCSMEIRFAKRIGMSVHIFTEDYRVKEQPVVAFDLDGTLFRNDADMGFNKLAAEIGSPAALAKYSITPDMWDFNVPLNYELLKKAQHYKQLGYKVIVFTNRFPMQDKRVKENLGCYASIFEQYIYGCGYKKGMHINGILFDNDSKYVACATEFVHVETYSK